MLVDAERGIFRGDVSLLAPLPAGEFHLSGRLWERGTPAIYIFDNMFWEKGTFAFFGASYLALGLAQAASYRRVNEKGRHGGKKTS